MSYVPIIVAAVTYGGTFFFKPTTGKNPRRHER